MNSQWEVPMGERENRLAAVQARLERVSAVQELSPVLEPGAVAELHRLTEILRENDGDLQARYVLGWLHWYRFQALPEGQDSHDLVAAVDMFTPCFLARVEDMPEPLRPILAEQSFPAAVNLLQQALDSADQELISANVDLWRHLLAAVPTDHSDRAACLCNLGIALRGRFERMGEQEDLDAAIEVEQAALDAIPANHPDRAACLCNLGSALQTRFGRTGGQEDLDAAVEVGQAALEAIPTNHPSRAMYLSNLGNALRVRFGCKGRQEDLDAAVEVGQAAVDATAPNHPERAMYLSNLGNALQIRSECTGGQADLDAAIAIFEAARDATPPNHPNRAGYLSNLGNALRVRFGLSGRQADLDAAIEVGQAARDATAPHHPERAMYLSNLGNALQIRSECTGGQADLDAAIAIFETAVDATAPNHPHRAACLSNLGNALRVQFEHTGRQEHLDAAIEVGQAAVDATAPNHPERAMYLSNLGIARQTRFGRTGGQEDLDAAIEVGQAAVDATAPNHPAKAVCLSNLGNTLRLRFGRTGRQEDLDAAIEVGQAAVDATAPNNPNRAKYLSNLGNALQARSERTGGQEDLGAAIEVGQAAVDATAPNHPERAMYLSNLGNALQARFERTGGQADLDAAIPIFETAVDATDPNHPNRAIYLSNLGNALLFRFECTGEQADLGAAIEVGQAAVDATDPNNPNRAGYLSNLGNALLLRFECTGEQADLGAAIEVGQAAVDATAPNNPNRASHLVNVGNALRARSEYTGQDADLDTAVSVYVQATQVGSAAPSTRIRAAYVAASLVAPSQPGRAASLLEGAVRLLPEVTPRQLERSDRQHALGGFAGLAGEAAAFSLADAEAPPNERATRALQLLEAGRAVLLSQALEIRSDLTDLTEHHPGLAVRFAELRDLLDRPMDTADPLLTSDDKDWSDRTARDRRRVAEELARTLIKIRALEGFRSFALPPTVDELLAQAAYGPVAVFNVSPYRSDVLLLTQNGIASLELPALTYDTVVDQINAFQQALPITTDRDVTSADRRGAQAKLRGVLEWLWDSAAEPVLSALGHHSQRVPSTEWPRVWWVPGGLLGQLPFHAAGYHTDAPGKPGRRTVMDRVISSYTPTIRALRHARQHTQESTAAADRALIVAMPTTPEVNGRLRYVPAEVAMLRTRLPQSMVLTEPDPLEGDDVTAAEHTPTRANVLALLPDYPVAHFACHGDTHPTDPSKSLLLLHDHRSDPLTVASLAGVNLGQARLAYLSACRTAFIGTSQLIDEAIHLSSAFQLAGYPHVIATLWEIDSAIAVTIADTFYTALNTAEDSLATDRAVHALHHAVRAIRDQHPGLPSLWAAHLHAGR
ncbi:CHAT domain-containing protein [Streptomyces sp. NPDC002926]